MRLRGDFPDVVGGLALRENCVGGDAGALFGRKFLFGLVEVFYLVEQERVFESGRLGLYSPEGLGTRITGGLAMLRFS